MRVGGAKAETKGKEQTHGKTETLDKKQRTEQYQAQNPTLSTIVRDFCCF